MDNKLVFKPQTLTAYNWIRYRLIEDKTYKWDKYATVPEYLHHYYWNKYSIITDTTFYIWNVYDELDNPLGQVGSYRRNAFSDDGYFSIGGGPTLKCVYVGSTTTNYTAHAWDEYKAIKRRETTTIRTYNKSTVATAPYYCWNRYRQAEYGYLRKRFEKITGSQATSVCIDSGIAHENPGYIEPHTLRTLYLYDDKKIILAKNKPYAESTNNTQSPSGYRLRVGKSSSIEIDIDTLNNNDDLLAYINAGYKYWIPSKYYNHSASNQYFTIDTRGIYYEFIPETYYTNHPYSEYQYQLHNIVVRTTIASGVSSILTNRTYGDLIPDSSSEGEFVDSIATCYNFYKRTGLTRINDVYHINRNYYPDNDFYGLALHIYNPEGETTTNVPGTLITTVTTKNNDSLYPNYGILNGYFYELIDTSSTTSDNKYVGEYLGRVYAPQKAFYTTDGIQPTRGTYLKYRGEIDLRYNHKWYKYRSGFEDVDRHNYEWVAYNWNLDDTSKPWDAYIGKLKEIMELRPNWVVQDGNTYKIYPITKVTENTPADILELLYYINILTGRYENDTYKVVNNEVQKVGSIKTDYYNSNQMPSKIIDNSLSINDTDYLFTGDYISITVDGNDNVISGKGYVFISGSFKCFPYEYLGEVISPYINDFPTNGIGIAFDGTYVADIANEYYYVYQGQVNNEGVRGDFIDKVETNFPNVYPNDGVADGFWWVYQPNDYYKNVIKWIKQGKIGTVTSVNNINAYPEDGVWPNDFNEGTHYYYRYIGYTSAYAQGTFIERLKTYIRTSYPDNSFIVNDAWYIYAGETYETTAELTIDNTKLMGGVNYTQEINPSEDLQIGSTSAAQVDFTIYAPDAAAATQYLGKDFEYYVKMNSDNDWRKIGTFVLTTAELPDKQTAHIQGFDFVNRFDVVVDEWLDELTFPLSLGDLFTSLCEYVGCEAYSTSFTNADFMVNDNFEAVQITGRTILQYITEVSGGFCVAEPDGRIRIKHYSQPLLPVNLGSDSYKKYTHEVYTVPVISSVIVRKDDDDEGVESNV